MPTCVVKCCKNYMSKVKKSQGITYHTFPRNKKRKDDWILIIQNCRRESNWYPSSASTVCSAHFDNADFITTATGLRCLVPYAIPKKLLTNTTEMQTQRTLSPIPQMSPNGTGMANDKQTTSSASSMITSSSQIHTLHKSSEEYIIKIENESQDKASNTGVLSQSAEPKLQHYLITVKRERDDSCDDDNALEETKNRNSSAGVEGLLVGDVSTETAKDMMKHLQAFRQDDLYDAFGRYVASALRSMSEQRAQRLQPRIVRLLAGEDEDV